MKLYSPQFEKTLRRGVKNAIRSSPELKREYKRAGKSRNSRFSLLALAGAAVVPAFFLFAMVNLARRALSGLALLNVIAFWFALAGASGFWGLLHTARDLPILFLLPMEEPAIFRWKIGQFLKAQTLALLMLLGGLGSIGIALQFSLPKLLGILPIVLLAWVTQTALTVHCAARMPRRVLGFLMLGGMLAGFLLFFTFKYFGPWWVMVFERYAEALNLLLPTGWPLWFFRFLEPDPPWFIFALLLPIGTLICTVPSSLRLLQRGFGFKERTQPLFADLVTDLLPDTAAADVAAQSLPGEKPRRLGETAIADIILARQFLGPPPWSSRGLFERWFWRVLNNREKALSDLVFPNGEAISTPWRTVFRIMLVVLAAGAARGVVNEEVRYWVIGVGLVTAMLIVLTTVLSSGRAFQPVACSGVNIPMYAAFGVGFKEMSNFLLKFSLVQLPPLLAFTIAGAGIVFYTVHGPLTLGIGIALKLAFLVLAARFISITSRFSGCTNDSSALRIRSFVIFLIMASPIFLFLIGAIAGLVLRSWLGWLVCVGVALDAFALYRTYRWFYNNNWFDLMSQPRR